MFETTNTARHTEARNPKCIFTSLNPHGIREGTNLIVIISRWQGARQYTPRPLIWLSKVRKGFDSFE